MKTFTRKNILNEFYNIRAAIYSLLVFSSLLFLLNLKHISLDFDLYLIILGVIVFAIISEFLFATLYSSKVYHSSHPLRGIYKTVRRKHLYNIILLPVVQFVTCGLIIYYSGDILIELLSIFITTIFTYFTIISYSKLYEHNLEVSYEIEEFFDASKYVSFAFLSYLLLVLYVEFLIPRSFIAMSIGGIQLIYILSALWRRNKINIQSVSLSFLSGALISGFVYLHLVNISLLNQLGLIEISTAHVLLFDYVLTSLILRWVDKKFSITALLEYTLVVLISISLLAFSS